MSYLDGLEKELSAALTQNSVGTPVTVRGTFQLTADHGLLMPVLARVVEAASSWFGSAPARLYALGGVQAGYITVLAEYAKGKTALLTAETYRREEPAVTVLLVGNHGTLRFDDTPGEVAVSERDSPIRERIEASLRTAAPVEVSHAR